MRPMKNFVKDCLNTGDFQGKEMKPHLESTPILEQKEDKKSEEIYDETAPIRQLNRENFKNVLNSNKISVIAVFAKRCPACRELEPKLPQLQRMLEE